MLLEEHMNIAYKSYIRHCNNCYTTVVIAVEIAHLNNIPGNHGISFSKLKYFCCEIATNFENTAYNFFNSCRYV